MLESLGGSSTDDIVAVMAATYAHGAPALAKFAARQAPVDLDAEIEPIPRRRRRSGRGRAPRARSGLRPVRVRPVPGAVPAGRRSSPSCRRAVSDGGPVAAPGARGRRRRGHPRGAARARRSTSSRPARCAWSARAGDNKAVERGRLHEGSLFGEMALVTEQARTASVQVVGEADLLEVDRAAVARLCAEVPVLAERLDQLRARAAAQEPARDVAAVQAVRSPAADGAAQALRGARPRARDGGHPRGRRRPGAVRHPARRGRDPAQGRRAAASRRSRSWAPARCSARCPCWAIARRPRRCARCRATTIMFLGRDYFRRLVQALPPLRQYFEELSKQRAGARACSARRCGTSNAALLASAWNFLRPARLPRVMTMRRVAALVDPSCCSPWSCCCRRWRWPGRARAAASADGRASAPAARYSSAPRSYSGGGAPTAAAADRTSSSCPAGAGAGYGYGGGGGLLGTLFVLVGRRNRRVDADARGAPQPRRRPAAAA